MFPSTETSRQDEPDDDARSSRLAVGFVGGTLATVVMTAFRAPTARSLPPTADFLSRWFGGSTDDYPLSSLLLHLAYGALGGVLFAVGFERRIDRTDEPEIVGMAVGAVYGMALSVVGERLVVRHLVGLDLDTDESAVFHAGHLVYGLTLGVWTGSRG